jgi:hypothetical protein
VSAFDHYEEKPTEPASVAHVVRDRTSLLDLAQRAGLGLEHLWELNRELRGWTRTGGTRTNPGELAHVLAVEPGTTVHLPLGAKVEEDQDQETVPELPAPAKGAKTS